MSAPGDACSGLSWTIDPWGNRLAQTVTGGSCLSPTVSVDTHNRFIGSPYLYDASGNLLNDGSHSYAYDAEGRISTVDSGATATYVYDAAGNRVDKKTGGVDYEYLYDQSSHVNAQFNNGVLQRMYVYLGDRQLAEYFGNTTSFVHYDNLGSTRLLTGMDQSIPESDDYYPYGEPITTGTTSILKFTGKERDAESGLDNFGARYDASSLGRFMTPDWAAKPTTVPYASFGNPQSLNLYSYVLNNPLSRNDPDGHLANCAGDAQQKAQCASDLKKLAPGTKVTADGTVKKASLLHRVVNHLDGNGAGTALVSRIVNDQHMTTGTSDPGNPSGGTQLNGDVKYDPAGANIMTRDANGNLGEAHASGTVILGHELIHQDHENRGLQDMSPADHIFSNGGAMFSETVNREEFRTAGFSPFVMHGDITENQLEKQLDQPVRATYTGPDDWVPVPQN